MNGGNRLEDNNNLFGEQNNEQSPESIQDQKPLEQPIEEIQESRSTPELTLNPDPFADLNKSASTIETNNMDSSSSEGFGNSSIQPSADPFGSTPNPFESQPTPNPFETPQSTTPPQQQPGYGQQAPNQPYGGQQSQPYGGQNQPYGGQQGQPNYGQQNQPYGGQQPPQSPYNQPVGGQSPYGGNQPQYGQYNNYPGQRQSNPLGIIALIVGIVSLVGLCSGSGIFAVVAPIAAIVLGVMSRKKVGPNGMATAGIVLGIISLVFGIILLVLMGAFMSSGLYYEIMDELYYLF